MKRPLRPFIHSLFGALLAVGIASSVQAQETRAYVVADATTGHILAASNPTKKLQVASLTKVATAVVVLDWADSARVDLGQNAIIPPSAFQFGGPNPIGFQPGDSASLRDLLYAALMQSDNLAAQALAEHVGGTLRGEPGVSPVDLFVAQMNALARSKGMVNTLFLNPHGLDSIEKKLPYSTAADMARLASFAVANSAFRFYVSQTERQITVNRAAGGAQQYLLRNTNELLGVDAVDGVKTGTTSRSGECLILSASRAPEARQEGTAVTLTPRRLVVVVLGASNRFQIARGLLSSGWQRYDAWAAAGRPRDPKSSL